MLSIKYQPYTLLYGHSLFWVVQYAIAPLHLLPNLEACKCKFVIEQLPFSATTFWLVSRARRSPVLKLLFSSLFMSAQTFYLFIFLICNFLIKSDSLVKFGALYPESLTYKVLYNTPILSNGGLLIITLMNMLDSESSLWKMYDDFDTTSIDYAYQARVAKRAMLLTVPEILLSVFEMLSMAQYVLQSDYYEQFFVGAPHFRLTFGWLFYATLLTAGVLNIIIRYRPVLTLFYVSTCMSKHLAFINSQLLSDSDKRLATDRAEKVAWGVSLATVRHRYSDLMKRVEIYDNRVSLPYNATGQGPVEDEHDKTCGSRQADQATETTMEKFFYIGNLYQLERHLTQMGNFLYDIDRVGPECILTVTAVNFVTYFFLVFHTAFEPTWALALTFTGLCCARTLPLGAMFIAGSWIERECSRLEMKLESIYLRHKTQSLIYKQMAGSHLSLARILKILERISLDCHGLMKVNIGTLKKCFIYLITLILIVVQYDSLMYVVVN